MILLASCQQTCMTYTIAVCTVKNSWCWTEELSEACRVLFQKYPPWSCSQAVSKPVWHIPSLCVQWKNPDDGHRNCPKHEEFYSKNKFEKSVHLVRFIIRNNTHYQWLLLSRGQNMSLCFPYYHQSFSQKLRQYRKNRLRSLLQSFTSEILFIIRRHLNKRLRKWHVTELVPPPFVNYICTSIVRGDRGGTVVKVLWYKSEGRWLDPSWCQWNFSFT